MSHRSVRGSRFFPKNVLSDSATYLRKFVSVHGFRPMPNSRNSSPNVFVDARLKIDGRRRRLARSPVTPNSAITHAGAAGGRDSLFLTIIIILLVQWIVKSVCPLLLRPPCIDLPRPTGSAIRGQRRPLHPRRVRMHKVVQYPRRAHREPAP